MGVMCRGHALIRLACQNHGFTHSESEYSGWAGLYRGHNEQYEGNDTGEETWSFSFKMIEKKLSLGGCQRSFRLFCHSCINSIMLSSETSTLYTRGHQVMKLKLVSV